MFKRKKKRNISIQDAIKLENWICNNVADDVSDMWDFRELLSISKEFKDTEISNEMVEYVSLATLMPYQRIVYFLDQFDSGADMTIDEIQFVLDLKNTFEVSTTNEVIKRIRYVRGLKKWVDANGKQ